MFPLSECSALISLGGPGPVHSTCGTLKATFGPDNRINEEWFGLYGAAYTTNHSAVRWTPRAAVAELQKLWGPPLNLPSAFPSDVCPMDGISFLFFRTISFSATQGFNVPYSTIKYIADW